MPEFIERNSDWYTGFFEAVVENLDGYYCQSCVETAETMLKFLRLGVSGMDLYRDAAENMKHCNGGFVSAVAKVG
jgi:hypothetical protein